MAFIITNFTYTVLANGTGNCMREFVATLAATLISGSLATTVVEVSATSSEYSANITIADKYYINLYNLGTRIYYQLFTDSTFTTLVLPLANSGNNFLGTSAAIYTHAIRIVYNNDTLYLAIGPRNTYSGSGFLGLFLGTLRSLLDGTIYRCGATTYTERLYTSNFNMQNVSYYSGSAIINVSFTTNITHSALANSMYRFPADTSDGSLTLVGCYMLSNSPVGLLTFGSDMYFACGYTATLFYPAIKC